MTDAEESERDAIAWLSEVGKTLYGRRWQTSLAAQTGISRETIRRWILGQSPLRSDNEIFDRALEILRQRAATVTKTADELERWMKKRSAARLDS